MSERKINITELAAKFGIMHGCTIHSNPKLMKENFENYSKELAKKVLELAAENALVESISDDNGKINEVSESIYKPHQYNKRLDENIHVNKQSILDTIKQVE